MSLIVESTMPLGVRRLALVLLALTACADDPSRPEAMPVVEFLDVRTDVPGLSCQTTGSCTVPVFARLQVRFTAAAASGIRGYQWRLTRPQQPAPPYAPYASDTRFLVATLDTVAVVDGDTLWELRAGVVTVRVEAAGPDSASSAGTLRFEARAQDNAGRVSSAETGRLEFQVSEPEPPTVVFLDLQNDRHDLQPCVGVAPCTVPWSARLRQRWTARVGVGAIAGYQWQVVRPHGPPDPLQPFGVDSLFLRAGADTLALDANGDVLWSIERDTLTVHFAGARRDTFQDVGELVFRVRVLDTAGRFSAPASSERAIQLVNPPSPTVQFLAVRAARGDLLPCVAALPCTMPAFTPYRVSFRGASAYNYVRGYTWRNADGTWGPYNTPVDTLFLPVGRDTTSVDANGDTLWTLIGDVLTTYDPNRLDPPGWPQHHVQYLARVRDDAGITSLLNQGRRTIVVNFEPETRLHAVPACDCPDPPPGCSTAGERPLGWITGIGSVDSFALQDWIPFCAGDTIPNYSFVRFYASGWDDWRDAPRDPELGLQEVQMRWRFEAGRGLFQANTMPLSDPALALADLPLPGGGTFHGAAVGWRACPFDIVVHAAATDENMQPDGTFAALPFHVGGAPSLDSLAVPGVIVFVPTCAPAQAALCPNVSQAEFGPDTLLVFGRHVPDASDPRLWQTPLGLGWNDFVFPFRGWGHDHPRDRNPETGPAYYDASEVGRIRAWRYGFDCTPTPCADVQLQNEGIWLGEHPLPGDSARQQVFDPVIQIRMPLDTLCVTVPCNGNTRVRLESPYFGAYRFTLQGRDTDATRQICRLPSDLGPKPFYFDIDLSRLGLETGLGGRNTVWVPLETARPSGKGDGGQRLRR